VQINGVYFEQESSAGAGRKSPESQSAQDSARWTQTLKTRASANGTSDTGRFLATKALLGYAKVVGGGTSAYLSRATPAWYPAIVDPDTNPLGTPYAWATSISKVEPMGQVLANDPVTVSPTYGALRFTVDYNVLPYNIFDDNTAIQRCATVPNGYLPGFPNGTPHEGLILGYLGWNQSRYVARYIKSAPTTWTLPNGIMQFNTVFPNVAPKASFPGIPDQFLKFSGLPSGFPVTVYREYVRYVWMNVPYAAVPRNTIAQTVNCVNKQVFDGYLPGTLFYTSADYDPGYSPLGYRTMNVTHNFIYMPNTGYFVIGLSAAGPPVQPLSVSYQAGIAMGWNSFITVQNGNFYFWPISGNGAPSNIWPPGTAPVTNGAEIIFDPISGQNVRGINGTEPYSYKDFAPLFAPDGS
jgi:hypothetical protein